MAEIIDAHQHFWRVDADDYPWLTPALGPLHRDFGPADLAPHLDACGVGRTVLVQAMDSAADTAAMLAVAERWPRVAGVVGWVDLLCFDGSGLDRLVGVRHLVNGEPDREWLGRPELADSLAVLAERDLVFEVPAVNPRHMSLTLALARRHPTLTVVVDHLGTPPIRDGGWEPWAGLMSALALLPNVATKLSGLTTLGEGSGDQYVRHALDAFGPSRVLWGSDWPVCEVGAGYKKWWTMTQALLAGLASADRALILGGNARRLYRLGAAS